MCPFPCNGSQGSPFVYPWNGSQNANVGSCEPLWTTRTSSDAGGIHHRPLRQEDSGARLIKLLPWKRRRRRKQLLLRRRLQLLRRRQRRLLLEEAKKDPKKKPIVKQAPRGCVSRQSTKVVG